MKNAFLFAGQGAQTVGMTKNIAAVCPQALNLFTKANEILGFDLANICFNGPQEKLNRTDICQPALLVGALACLEFAKSKKKIAAEFCTGLSLGEYTALVYAGTLEFGEAVKIVKIRGELMQKDCDKTPSGMASVIGLDADKVEAACKEASQHGIIRISNINSPEQIVISGETKALEQASDLCKSAGAKRVIPLKVAGAYHSGVMNNAQMQLNSILDKVEFKDPTVKFVSNVTGAAPSSGREIKDLMKKQIISTVNWDKTIRTMISNGVTTFYEFGPGQVLSGLVKRISDSATCYSIEEPADIDQITV